MASSDGASLDQLAAEELAVRKGLGLLRQRRALLALDAVHVELDGRRLINFASNNYLGLTHHPALIQATGVAQAALGAGSGAAALVTGFSTAHQRAEARLAQWKGTESALLFPSGYQANLSAVQTLAALGKRRGGTRFLIDKLAHASLIDAVRATGAPYRVLPHNHLAKLERLLNEAPAEQMQAVLTESIFSMDGDAADLVGLARLKARRPFVLLLDEAHASGVYGPDGSGLAAEMGLPALADLSIATLSKAIGLSGGAICGSRTLIEAVVNCGRGYVYSTHVPPACAAALVEAIEVIRAEPQRRQRVRRLAQRVRASLSISSGAMPGDSPIIPVLLGDERRALDAAERLLERGLLVPAIRPPTVPRGGSRLRITVSSAHQDDEIELLVGAIRDIQAPT